MCITLARRPCFTPYSKPCDTKTCLTLESSVLYRLRLLMVSVASVVLVNACVAPGPSICGSQNTEELPRNETSRRLVDPWEKFVLTAEIGKRSWVPFREIGPLQAPDTR